MGAREPAVAEVEGADDMPVVVRPVVLDQIIHSLEASQVVLNPLNSLSPLLQSSAETTAKMTTIGRVTMIMSEGGAQYVD